MVTQPTRKDNILNVFLTNRPTLTTRSTTLPGLGDHDIVFIGTSTSAKRSKPVKRLIHLWKIADVDLLRSKCHQFQQHSKETYTTTSNINTVREDIKDNLLKFLDSCVPTKMSSPRFSQPWINRDI